MAVPAPRAPPGNNLLLLPQLNKLNTHCSGPLFSNRCWWLDLPHHFQCPNFFFLLPPELDVCVSLPGAQRASLGLIPRGSVSVSSELLAARAFGLCLLAPNPAKQFGLCCVLLGCSLQLPAALLVQGRGLFAGMFCLVAWVAVVLETMLSGTFLGKMRAWDWHF